MNYFTRERKDGKVDVLEGTAEEPGRVVCTFDTQTDAEVYITEQHAEIEELFTRVTSLEDSPAEEVMAAGEEDDMAYKLVTKAGQTCVVGKEDGKVVKCHDDREKAVAQLKALYANKADASVQAAIAEFEQEVVGDSGPETITLNTDGTLTKVDVTDNTITVTAHAEPPTPPTDFFSEPPSEYQRRYVTVTDDGRVMGLLATYDECHVGYGEMCVTPPREADYSHFAVGTVLTSEGSTIATGVIAINGGHADLGLDASSARSHYDDAASGLVDVVVGASEHGIWFSGALRPGATPDQVHALRASGVSGDWRLIDGELRLIGICSVNVPGFPKLSIAASADGLTALVAAGGPPESHPDLCECQDKTQDILEELDSLQRLVADAGIEEQAIERLSSRIHIT